MELALLRRRYPPTTLPLFMRDGVVRYCLVTMGRRPYPPGVQCQSGR
jgi:hypothetical protein